MDQFFSHSPATSHSRPGGPVLTYAEGADTDGEDWEIARGSTGVSTFQTPSSAGCVWRDPHKSAVFRQNRGAGFRASIPVDPRTKCGRVAVRSKDTVLHTVSSSYRLSRPGVCQVNAPNPNAPPVRKLRIVFYFSPAGQGRRQGLLGKTDENTASIF